MDVIKVFQKFFGIVLTQHTAEQTKKYAQRWTAKSVTPFTFQSMIRKWHNVTVGKMYVVLALFMLMEILQ
jgi:hypothetical protein